MTYLLPTYLPSCLPTYLPCDTNYNTDNWEPGLMIIFVTWQLSVTLDSIRNSCDVCRPVVAEIQLWKRVLLLGGFRRLRADLIKFFGAIGDSSYLFPGNVWNKKEMMVFFRNLIISGSPPLKSVLPLIADSGQNNSQSPTSQSSISISISISTDEKNVSHAGTRGEVQENDKNPMWWRSTGKDYPRHLVVLKYIICSPETTPYMSYVFVSSPLLKFTSL